MLRNIQKGIIYYYILSLFRKPNKNAIHPVKTKRKEKRRYNGSVKLEDETFSDYTLSQKNYLTLSDVMDMTISSTTYPSPRPTLNNNNNININNTSSSSETVTTRNRNIQGSITSLQKEFTSDTSRKTPRQSIPLSTDNNNNNQNTNDYDPTLLIDTDFIGHQEFVSTSTVPVNYHNNNNNNKHAINNGVLYSTNAKVDGQTTPLNRNSKMNFFSENSTDSKESFTTKRNKCQTANKKEKRIASQPITPADEKLMNFQTNSNEPHSLSPVHLKHLSAVQLSLGGSSNSKSSGSTVDNSHSKNCKISIIAKEEEKKNENDLNNKSVN